MASPTQVRLRAGTVQNSPGNGPEQPEKLTRSAAPENKGRAIFLPSEQVSKNPGQPESKGAGKIWHKVR